MFSLIMPYYLNPGMLARHYAEWSSWPESLRARVAVIIVDDASPVPAHTVPRPAGLPLLSIYRVLEDKPWHQHAARNLGADRAENGWMLLTDMDHLLTEANAIDLLEYSLDEKSIYTLARVEADTGLPTMQNGQKKPHPNSFVVTRQTYWQIGGYDEDYCGIYGTDGMFRSRAAQRAKLDHLPGVALHRFTREMLPDASTTTLQRKEGREPYAKQRIAKQKANRGEADVIKTLQFKWERIV